jgi:hypothetical protein
MFCTVFAKNLKKHDAQATAVFKIIAKFVRIADLDSLFQNDALVHKILNQYGTGYPIIYNFHDLFSNQSIISAPESGSAFQIRICNLI